MAELTTTEGAQLYFDPAALSVLTDADPSTHAVTTCIYGLNPAPLHVAESAEALLERLGLDDRFVVLTRLDGRQWWVKAPGVSQLRAPLPGDYAPGAGALVFAGGMRLAVRESVVGVRALVNTAGGRL